MADVATQQQNSNRWCWTLNNYTQAEVDQISLWDTKYSVYGRETGESGTPHLQGFTIFVKRMRLAAVKKLVARAHWEVSRGDNLQASTYCKKENDYVESGILPLNKGDGEKERWSQIRDNAKRGLFDDIDADVFIRHYRTLKEIRKDYMDKPGDLDAPCGVWYSGVPGAGKSYNARKEYPGAYMKMQNKWWDGYQGEEFVIMDDVDSKEMGHLLKIWSDQYSFLAETKGGAMHIRPKKFIVTSNYSLYNLFGADSELHGALARRFTPISMEVPFVSI
nr:MAG: replication associated protein [Cressdnaviricota sp.]